LPTPGGTFDTFVSSKIFEKHIAENPHCHLEPHTNIYICEAKHELGVDDRCPKEFRFPEQFGELWKHWEETEHVEKQVLAI
jgi:hypothetical protein